MLGPQYLSLSLLPRFVRPAAFSDDSPATSSLLASMARRSCSSSYAASLLFIVDLRFELLELDGGRDDLEPFGLGDSVPSLAREVAWEVARDDRWRGRYFEYLKLCAQSH